MNKFNVIIDSSGSMVEWGKSDVLINTMHTIKNYTSQNYSNYEIDYYFWGESIEKFDVSIDTKSFKKKLNCKNELKTLHDFTSNEEINILISDGNFESNKKIDFTSNKIICVLVGCDCDEKNLLFLSKFKECYQPHDILTAIDFVCNGGL